VHARAGGQLVDLEVDKVNWGICNKLFLKVPFNLELKKVVNEDTQCVVAILDSVDLSNAIRAGPCSDSIKTLHTSIKYLISIQMYVSSNSLMSG
jgi:hypothetical protein